MVVNLAQGLKSRDHTCSICCLEREADLEQQAEIGGIRVHHLNKDPGLKPGIVLKLRKLLRQEKIDVLHSHNVGSLLYGATAARFAGTPVVVHTEHGRLLNESDNPRTNRGERFVSRWVDEMVAVSEPTRERYAKITGIPIDRIRIVENGIDIKKYQKPADPRLRNDLGIRAEDYVIGIVARISEEKNHSLLLKSIQQVLDVSKNIKLLIVGDGPNRAKIEKEAKDLGIDHKVIFTGIREDVPSLLALIDLFVLCSKTEGMPLTLLEAMAAGKAIICTAVGGIPNILSDGVNGLLIPSNDATQLTNAILQLLRDRNLATRLRNAARKDAEENYSLEKMAQAYEEIYLAHWNTKKRK